VRPALPEGPERLPYLRTPHVRAAALRVRLAILTLLLGALLAACGGSTATVQEAPGPPVALDEPGNAAALAPSATATPTATASATATPTTSTGTTSSGTTGTSTSPSGTSGTTPSTQTGSTGTSTQPPPPGSDAQKFEQFCAQNPGAC